MAARDPIRIGMLYDFPQGDGGASFEAAVRLGLEEMRSTDGLEVEFLAVHARGLPAGTEDDVRRGLRELDDAGVLLVLGPSISDNGVVARPLADELELGCINYTGGERTRSEFMFHYQVGSLEEEPAVLARRLADRGLRRAAICFDDSVVGQRYRECFEHARRVSGIEVVAETAIPPLSDRLHDTVAGLRAHEPGALVYLGLGVAAHAVAVALRELDWSVPVVANSALMFGYAMPAWRDDWRGWEYVDTIADDNPVRLALRKRSRQAGAGPLGCAAYDLGRLAGEAINRAPRITRAGAVEGLQRVKQLPAASGHDGTMMGFGQWDRAALKGRYLVLREWHQGRSIEVRA